QAYALKWGLFADWCSSRREDLQRCLVGVVLSFLQEKLERRQSPSTLEIYVAAIAVYHDAVDGLSLGKHYLIIRDQVVNLQALPSEEADLALALLCPVRALRTYVDRTRSFRRSKHSTWSVGSSYVLVHAAFLADICRTVGWATPNTFARFYNLRVEPVSSHVLSLSPRDIVIVSAPHVYLNHVKQFRIVAFSRGDPKYLSYLPELSCHNPGQRWGTWFQLSSSAQI
ncbi:hypothetical protein M9458_052356, partial [Cirrhinus mrigala]